MLSKEVYFRNGRWWFAVVELGRLGQAIDTVVNPRRCKTKKDAVKQAAQALKHMEAKLNAS